jgi:hypothetical protein
MLVTVPDVGQTQAQHPSSRLEDVIAAAKPHLTNEEFQELEELLTEYEDIFARNNEDYEKTNKAYHRIDMGDARPIRQTPRRLPLAKQAEVSEMLDNMQRHRVIKESDSPWSSPVVLLRKKNGELRFCVDYRKLNDVTEKDCFPLPQTGNTLDTLAGTNWFSTLDLKSGYWQVGVHPDKEKTAFSTGQGLWQFTVMPFRLCNTLVTFERLMETVLRGLTYDSCLVYLYNVIVVFQRFSEARLKLNPEKCQLLQKEVRYLRHTVSPGGITTDPEKLKAVHEWPTPKNKHEVRGFLGLCTHYRLFIFGFTNIAKPLTKLTEQKQFFQWTPEALCAAPILAYPRPDERYIVDTDASNIGIGRVLSQLQDGQARVIAYYSKMLTKPKRNYYVTPRELLAIVNTLEHFRKYLYGQEFHLCTTTLR